MVGVFRGEVFPDILIQYDRIHDMLSIGPRNTTVRHVEHYIMIQQKPHTRTLLRDT